MPQMICTRCKHNNRANSKFCTQCGHKLEEFKFEGARISILTNDHSSVVFPLKPGHRTIGRDIENSIVINDEQVSKFHATIIYEDDTLFIQDLQSSNGVYISGQRVKERTKLYNGCLIKLGSTMLKFENNSQGK